MSTVEIDTASLMQWLDATLQPQAMRDYCPNGLQVAGRSRIRKLVTGVTASLALLQAAIERQADAVLVHHGWFWKNENPCLIGTQRARVALALQHELNVIAYHLPLDAHPTLGNNASLARVLDLIPQLDARGTPLTCGETGLVWLGSCAQPTTLAALERRIVHTLGRTPLVIAPPQLQQEPITRIAWCTGAAQGMMRAAVEAGAQVYLTGEVSEPNFHLALETGTAFIAAGHHATERYGVQALGQAAAQALGVAVEFVDLDNPV